MASRARPSFRSVSRLIDANLNRALEGLRVCEDIVRFHEEHPTEAGYPAKLGGRRKCQGARAHRARLARRLRALRHAVAVAAARLPGGHLELLRARDSRRDVGRRAPTTAESSLERLLLINFQRAKESLRVLEECARVVAPRCSGTFQAIRFRAYDLERDTLLTLAALRHP